MPIVAVAIAVAGLESRAAGGSEDAVSFSRDIRPLLASNCFACHGPDASSREADLRLDERGAAVDYGAIAPGDAEASLLLERVGAEDPQLRMPPPETGLSLTEVEIGLLRSWIDAGAAYSPHWSFVPPTRPSIPAVRQSNWPRNGIDYFVLHRLETEGLRPAPAADPYTLVRRACLDLTGLPPTPRMADEFAADPSDEAYERLVDRLLAAPAFGEHWARMWLDLARFADTKGYEKDLPRDMWPYRDWVIRALNEDMPYDEFSRDQLCGDLLPSPTQDQLIATAFHRNTMANDEGGTDDEEFRVAAVKDRVDTTIQAWMGVTAACAKCHSHKFDPISIEEYYQLFAVFNQTADADAFDEAPVLELGPDGGPAALTAMAVRATANVLSAAAGDVALPASALPEAADSASGRRERSPGSAADDGTVRLPIMRELNEEQRRVTRIHRRGNFLDPGEEVSAGVPAAFGNLPDDAPADRRALVRWLFAAENPLTARVAANRIWAQLFGRGIVESTGDFGSQGSPPSHPELLDWLATEFRDTHCWSLKRLCKTIVMSSTYRQSSVCEPSKLAVDRRNRLLSRGPRFRLPAEAIRDRALAVSGLLSSRMYGPPVMPPQPPGVWKSIYNARKWQTSEGEDRYRRGIYTYWKRTSPYPSMLIFDAESREVCTVQRTITNTPLQALVLMNDPVYLEAAAALAKTAIQSSTAPQERIAATLRTVLIRPPAADEVARLQQLQQNVERRLGRRPHEAERLLSACNAEPIASETPVRHAAYVVVASVVLTLDETITRN